MSINNINPPGLILPTQKSFIPGAGNPRDSAMMAGQEMNAKQASLNASVGGRIRRHRGGNNTVIVPQFQMLYTPQGGIGTNPNDQIKGISSTSMQSTSWSSNDNLATKMGGSRKRKYKKGGNSDFSWGCYSGGKRSKRNHSRKLKRKSRRHRR